MAGEADAAAGEDEKNEERIDLAALFPDLEPIKKLPSLTTVNGIGFGLYGRRGFDPTTGTYVKTHCFCFLFVPLFAWGAYRVADAEGGGWIFLGRVPLSRFARTWNKLFVLGSIAFVGLIGWAAHTSTPEYQASEKLARARRLAGEGKVVEATRFYKDLIRGAHRSAEATEGLRRLLAENLEAASAPEARQVLDEIVKMQRTGITGLVDEKLIDRLVEVTEAHAGVDPAAALGLLDLVEALTSRPRKLRPHRKTLLEMIVAARPGDFASLGRLARFHEEEKEFDRCVKLLAPHEKRLGSTEGARVLGQIYFRRGMAARAQALLEPYVEGRLAALGSAEAHFSAQHKAALSRANTTMRRLGRRKLSAMSRKRREELFWQQVGNDEPRAEALARWREASAVAPVALDLGLAKLRLARGIEDPRRRRAELKGAERIFVAVRGALGAEADVHLGKVYYWLGRVKEGDEAFARVLARSKRAPAALLATARALRAVGEVSRARQMAREAHGKAKETGLKDHAAGLLAVMSEDAAGKVKWLERIVEKNPAVLAMLHDARGDLAAERNDAAAAQAHYRRALAAYEKAPRSSSTLNNSGLVCRQLYRYSKKTADLDRALRFFASAVELDPSHSIVLGNHAEALLVKAQVEVLARRAELTRIDLSVDYDLMRFFYADEATRRNLAVALAARESFVRHLTLLERTYLLSPKSLRVVAHKVAAHWFTGDAARMRELLERMRTTGVDAGSSEAHERERLAGKWDGRELGRLDARLRWRRWVQARSDARRDPAAYAIAAAGVVQTDLDRVLYGGKVQAGALVALARRAYRARLSSGARSVLMRALLHRGGARVARLDSSYATQAARTRRALGHWFLAPYYLVRGGPTAARLSADPDVREAIGLVREQVRAFPGLPDPWEWAMLKRGHRAEADELARRIRGHELGRTRRAIQRIVWPMSAAVAMDACWEALLSGDEAGARKILAACAAKGVPLPG